MGERLETIPVESISINPENPRQVFHPTLDDRLAQSIETSGVLVPVYVYEEGDGYRLIDGERRWTQARRLGLEVIPALIRDDEPDAAENIVEMFNIHLVRAQWDDMPTATALAKVMERTGTTDADELKKLTGLSKEKIKDYQLILDLPDRYKKAISDGLPMNFFVELEENVIRPLGRQRPNLAEEFPPDALRDAFLAKRDAGGLPDVVQLRRMRPIIRQAAHDAGEPDQDSDLDGVIREVITSSEADIEDAFTQVALARVELDGLGKAARTLISSVDRLLEVTEGREEEQAELREVLEDTVTALGARIDQLD